MKVLIVSSSTNGKVSPFVQEQVDSLAQKGAECHYFFVEQKGIKGYLKHYRPLKKKIQEHQPDVIHAHYGLCGLLANLQRKIPVVTTYHGSDIHQKKSRKFSRWSIRLSAQNIYVSKKLRQLSGDDSGKVIACGVDAQLFQPGEMPQAKRELHLAQDTIHVLFSSRFDNWIKNSPLAKEAIQIAARKTERPLELMELKDATRDKVAHLLNASHLLLMTSFNEGSPQVIKEALAANRPIVSTAVGSVPELLEGLDGCFLVENDPESVAHGIIRAIRYAEEKEGTAGRERVMQFKLDLPQVADEILSIYQQLQIA